MLIWLLLIMVCVTLKLIRVLFGRYLSLRHLLDGS